MSVDAANAFAADMDRPLADDAALKANALKFIELAEEEQKIRDALNPIVRKKKATKETLLRELKSRKRKFVVLDDGNISVNVESKRASGPDITEKHEGLRNLGYDDDAITDILRVMNTTRRFNDDIAVTLNS